MIQRFLHNPLLLKIALVGIFCLTLFLFAVALIRKLRQNVNAEVDSLNARPQNSTAVTLAAYEGVIRQLREQGNQLQRAREETQQQAASNENINEAVLSNLSCGVLFFDRSGVVRQANRAAKSLLGYASPFSFHIRELFRGLTRVEWQESGEEAHSQTPFVEAMQQTLRTAEPFPRARIEYITPGGHKRVLGIAASAVHEKNGEIQGLSCVVNDLTELTEISQRVDRNENLASLGEISAGLVSDFKKSLNIISTHAENLVREDTSAASRYYAEKILSEAESLSRIVSEFLEFASSTKH